MAFYIKRGATLPYYEAQLVEDFGTIDQRPIDISDDTSVVNVYFVMSPVGDVDPVTPPKIRAPMVRVYPTVGEADPEFATKGGVVRYFFDTDDTNTAGEYQVEFDIDWGTGVETVPNRGYFSLIIEPDLG